MREKPQGCGLEGVELPEKERAPAYGGSTALQQREQTPPVPTRPTPTKSHLQAGGTLQPPHFLSQACHGRKFRGLQLQRLLATLASRPPCKPQKGKNRVAPRPANAHEHRLSRLWCKGGIGKFCALHGLITGLQGVILEERQTGTHTLSLSPLHTPIVNKAVDRNGGLVLPGTGTGRHRRHFLLQGSSQIARCCQCRVEDPGDSPGATGVQCTFYAAGYRTQMFPTPSRRIGTKRNKQIYLR